MSTLQRAIEIAVQAHAGQVDKSGRPYICHPMAVMRYMEGETAQICGVLHDVVEDNKSWTLDDLAAEGFAPEIIETLSYLTKGENENYWDYLDWVLGNDTACRVKLADLEDNLDPRRARPGNERYQVARTIVRRRLGLE